MKLTQVNQEIRELERLARLRDLTTEELDKYEKLQSKKDLLKLCRMTWKERQEKGLL